jgi:hypothetical protein
MNKLLDILFSTHDTFSVITFIRFSPGIPVSSTNKTDRHDITEILLNTINQPENKTIVFNNAALVNENLKIYFFGF